MNNNRTTVQSFYSGNLKEWVKIAPNVPAAQLQHKLKNPEAVSEYAQYVFLDVSHASNADIRRAVAAKLRVVTWTDDTTSQLRKAIENPNVAGFITNETADLAKF